MTPGRSRRVEMPRDGLGPALRDQPGVSASAIAATGTFTHGTHSQPRPSVRIPPRSTPAAPAEAGHGTPDSQRLVALGPVLEQRGDDREGGRGDDRRAEPLRRAGGDQLTLGRGEASRQGRDPDHGQTGHEDPTPAE